MAKLEPVDRKRCQAEKPNGANFMTLGGRPAMVRCKNVPKWIATEKKKGKDGLRGSMSLCHGCVVVLQTQQPDYATIKAIK